MTLITWDQKYSVGIEAFDNQHKILIKLINDLYDAMKAGEAKDKLSSVLEELVQYTVTHFASEEKMFDKYGYPETKEHKEEHKKFVGQVAAFQEDFESEKVTLTMDIMNFLKNWLFSHILGIDKKYTKFLNEKGVK